MEAGVGAYRPRCMFSACSTAIHQPIWPIARVPYFLLAAISSFPPPPDRPLKFDVQQVIADALGSVGLPVSMDKMIYLSERMFYQEGMTDAGYLDQCARLRNQLGGMTQVCGRFHALCLVTRGRYVFLHAGV